MKYEWHRNTHDIRDEYDVQILVLLPTNCTRKFLHIAGSLLAERLNTEELRKKRQKDAIEVVEGVVKRGIDKTGGG